ncbi:MAG TPA: replication factor C small subunit [Candidatus Diapherotrites archaeon]|uniref:Replication factor C small subunit n=1 Tax=Candidatus Iainarchaeum sp. TaxID=3101447 RepID=A0A7J4JH54_9ARCH|nr:replication factor C small subunit [Candidatus Diapherotrites archaeon]HIH16470.1 replication factor C small subunit [Candidatus Diapherotrites archaeon]
MGLPWVEKYRPMALKEVVGQADITKRLESYVRTRNLPNMMFSGPAGVGKTSASVAMARELFGPGFEQNFLELNASDQRGIDVVRSTIKDFARTLAFNAQFKIIFLDESDALTDDAQQALRRTMEKYTRTVRFILSCNYSSRIIEPIQSRCVVFRFRPLAAKEIEARLVDVAKKEKVEVDDKALKAIIYVAQGDMRKSINVLQASAAMGKAIDEKTVYEVSSRARPEEIKDLIRLALSGQFLPAREKLDTLLYEYGMAGEDVITQLYRELIDFPEAELDSKTKIALVDVIGEYNFRLVEGASERIQLEALLAQFMKYKK